MSQAQTEYIKTAGVGALVGITTSLVSWASNEIFHQPLGFSPVSFKNIIKVGLVSGATLTGVIAINEKLKLVNF